MGLVVLPDIHLVPMGLAVLPDIHLALMGLVVLPDIHLALMGLVVLPDIHLAPMGLVAFLDVYLVPMGLVVLLDIHLVLMDLAVLLDIHLVPMGLAVLLDIHLVLMDLEDLMVLPDHQDAVSQDNHQDHLGHLDMFPVQKVSRVHQGILDLALPLLYSRKYFHSSNINLTQNCNQTDSTIRRRKIAGGRLFHSDKENHRSYCWHIHEKLGTELPHRHSNQGIVGHRNGS